MTNNYVKMLTGKNQNDFETAAAYIINNGDKEVFSALVDKSDFLFDFIKENVRKRLTKAINKDNYNNLLNFLTIYSPDYDEVIISSLVKYADEDLTDKMLDIFENATLDEKAYAAKYFKYINDPLALDLLKEYSFSDFSPLATNCAEALSAFGDKTSYDKAINMLDSEDEFEKLTAVKFLIAYKDEKALNPILNTMITSSMSENIAAEICYLKPLTELFNGGIDPKSYLVLNNIINGLGEIIPLESVFDCELYDVLENLAYDFDKESNSKSATVLLNARQKFDQLTENDEYIFDEEKVVKEEIQAIYSLLESFDDNFLEKLKSSFLSELHENSLLVYTALELVESFEMKEALNLLKILLTSKNQTIVLKTVETLKSLNLLEEVDENVILEYITDENIRQIIKALF